MIHPDDLPPAILRVALQHALRALDDPSAPRVTEAEYRLLRDHVGGWFRQGLDIKAILRQLSQENRVDAPPRHAGGPSSPEIPGYAPEGAARVASHCRQDRAKLDDYVARVHQVQTSLRAAADQLDAARTRLEQLEQLEQAQVGYVPNQPDRALLRIVAHAQLPVETAGQVRRLVQRILARACPAHSQECAIRQSCTNKCGDMDAPPST